MTENERFVLSEATDRKCRSKRKRSSSRSPSLGAGENGKILLSGDKILLEFYKTLFMNSLYFLS